MRSSLVREMLGREMVEPCILASVMDMGSGLYKPLISWHTHTSILETLT